jgi:hypothetical protein
MANNSGSNRINKEESGSNPAEKLTNGAGTASGSGDVADQVDRPTGDGRRAALHQWFVIFSRPYVWLIGSVVLSVGAFLAAYSERHSDLLSLNLPHPFLPNALLLGAFGLSCFSVRKTRDHISLWSLVAFYLALFQFAVLGAYTYFGVTSSGADPATEIELAAVGLCGLGIVLVIVATWIGRFPFYEPIAIGLAAILLGAISIPGLRFFTKPFIYPHVGGSALLFGTGSPGQDLSLGVTTFPTKEVFKVNNMSGNQPIRWALLATGDAQIHTPPSHRAQTVHYQAVPQSVQHPNEHGQLFWGAVGSNSEVTFWGITRHMFASYTSDRTAASFPKYGEGNFQELDQSTKTMIESVLRGSPAFRQKHFGVNVRGGRLPPFASVTQSSPALTKNASDLNELAWTGHTGISVSFAITNQPAVDSTTNAMFVYVILLGVAGAGLIEAIRGAIKAVREENSPTDISQVGETSR